MNYPYVIDSAMRAGRNLEIRNETMGKARAAFGLQRKFLVDIARRHHRIALASLADARKWLVS